MGMELQNSLNDPSLIESTPLVTNTQLKTNRSNGVAIANHQFHKKKLSRLALDNNFSPIVFHTPKPLISNTPVFDESVVVDNLLTNNEANYESTLHCAQDTAGSPSLSKVTMGDITTFLAKSGHHQNFEQSMEITKYLITPEEEEELQTTNSGDLMEEIEKNHDQNGTYSDYLHRSKPDQKDIANFIQSERFSCRMSTLCH